MKKQGLRCRPPKPLCLKLALEGWLQNCLGRRFPRAKPASRRLGAFTSKWLFTVAKWASELPHRLQAVVVTFSLLSSCPSFCVSRCFFSASLCSLSCFASPSSASCRFSHPHHCYAQRGRNKCQMSCFPLCVCVCVCVFVCVFVCCGGRVCNQEEESRR